MEARVLSNNKGFTLIEIMIALVVSLLIFMGLMQTSVLGIDSNMRNILRAEAVQIAETGISQAKNAAYPPLPISSTPVYRNFRSISNFQYNTSQAVTTLDVCNCRVDVTVTWSWKGQNPTYTTSTVVRNQGNPSC